MKTADKYEFKKLAIQLNEMLICPKCSEKLDQIDISSFGACPYCNYTLHKTTELEDYLLKPAIDHWTSRQSYNTFTNLENLILPQEDLFE